MHNKSKQSSDNSILNRQQSDATIFGVPTILAGLSFLGFTIAELHTGKDINQLFNLNGSDIFDIVHTSDGVSMAAKTMISVCGISVGSYLLGKKQGMKLANT